MIDILIYVCIILCGFFVSKQKYFPKKITDKISILQMISIYILLGAMGFKLGSDREILSKLHILGLKSLIIAVFSIIFSVLLVNLFYKGDKR